MLRRGDVVGAKIAMSPDIIKSTTVVWNTDVRMIPNIGTLITPEGNLESSMRALGLSALSPNLLGEEA